MRTTITLDPDVAALIDRRMRERGIGFKEAVNEALRVALRPDGPRYETPTHSLGAPQVDLDRSLAVAAALEDAAIEAKLEQRR
jgi:hypothetical protein